jgi:hypothetical protein
MKPFSNLLRILDGNLLNKAGEELPSRVSGSFLFKVATCCGIEISGCSVSVSRFLENGPISII